jgi:hypothetical protein
MVKYRYKLFRKEHGSERFGPCEVCKKPMVGVSFHQIEERRYEHTGGGWTQHQCNDLFGHKACLMKKRRGEK